MDTEPIEPEIARQVEEWVREDLAQRFTTEFVFDPIIVERAYTWFEGDPYIQVLIIFDGDQQQLDPKWLGSMLPRIWDKVEDAGMVGFPSLSFIEKSEWDSEQRRKAGYAKRRKKKQNAAQ